MEDTHRFPRTSARSVENDGGGLRRRWLNARCWAWGSIAGGLMIGLSLRAETGLGAPLPASAVAFDQAEVTALQAAPVSEALSTRVNEAYGKLPLYFEPNQGQTDPQVKFLSRGTGYTLFLTSTEAVLRLQGTAPSRLAREDGGEEAVLRMKLLDAHANPEVRGVDALAGKVNYFRGTLKWRTHIPTYAQVRYEEVYPGIALVYYGHRRQLEYDFVVAPEADPTRIRLAFEGSVPRLNPQGDLILPTTQGEVRLYKPVVYQEVDGRRQEVTGRYVLYPSTGEGQGEGVQVGFEVLDYDRSRPLVIDPVLAYSTYLGGSGFDRGFSIAVDDAGQAYVTGETASTDFPTQNARQPALSGLGDAFVAKLGADGSTLVYSTYLGGSGSERGSGIAVDGAGQAYATGWTDSADFPTLNALQSTCAGGFHNVCEEAFVTKLSADGSALIYSTYLGGSSFDTGQSIAVDGAGQAYVTGGTWSADFPTQNALQPTFGGSVDGFISKLSNDGSTLSYSTYLGGSNFDRGESIAVDGAGQAYVTGSTWSTDFPTQNALQPDCGGIASIFCGDAFVTKLGAEGTALVYSTYLGGSFEEWGWGIAIDGNGQAHVTGYTNSLDFPTENALQPTFAGGDRDAFVAKLGAEGTALVYSTYLGGNNFDQGYEVAVDGVGQAYVTGLTNSTDFPTQNTLQPTLSGLVDAFVTKLGAEGTALVYSTYLGGSNNDQALGIAVDGAGQAYVTGYTDSPDFPTQAALQPGLAGSSDAFITKLQDATPVMQDTPRYYPPGQP